MYNRRFEAGPGLQRKRAGGGDDLGGGVAKRSKTEGVWDLRFLIPSQRAGAVIGKSGKHIVELRSKFNCKLVVPDCEGVPERLLLVRVSKELLPELLSTLVYKLAGLEEEDDSQRAEMKLLLHQKEAVALIGKGGSRIKEIREKTQASIKIFDKTCPLASDKVVRISGTVAVVTAAVSCLCEYLEHEEVQINDHYTYDPSNYDPYTAFEWGGMDPGDENFTISSNPKGGRGGGGGGGGTGGGGAGGRPPPREWPPGPAAWQSQDRRYNDYDYDYPPRNTMESFVDRRGPPRGGPPRGASRMPPNGRLPRRNY